MSEAGIQCQPVNTIDNKQPLYIIKAGGNVIDDDSFLQSFLEDFSLLAEKKILVHGGGKIATALGEKLGIEPNYIDGRRITDNDTIDLVTMVYAGLVNKKIVAALQSIQCNAIGLTGADANVLPARKRPVKSIDYGWVGDIDPTDIDMGIWRLFLDNKLVPVVAPLTHDGLGHILNTNADTIAAVLSRSLSRFYNVKLVYCFEKNGVLQDVNDEQSLLAQLNSKTYYELKENKKLFAGILPKIDNAFDAVNNGVQEVVIGNSSSLLRLVKGEGGTKIIL
ncbi:MAG: acetylglutamate kinase [Ginsengibacter sp.]